MAKVKIKADSQKIDINTALFLYQLVKGLKISTYSEFEQIEQLLKTLSGAILKRDQLTSDFRKSNSLPATEEIDQNHPLFIQMMENVFTKPAGIEKKELAIFSKETFVRKISGIDLVFDDIALLKFWLVK